VSRRISVFVSRAEPSPDGWLLHCEVGLEPIDVGDVFSYVHHADIGTEEPLSLHGVVLAEPEVRLSGRSNAGIRSGDILLAEIPTSRSVCGQPTR
jgi:hypothetical protein